MGNKRMIRHVMEERRVLLDRAIMVATGKAHEVVSNDGRLEDVTEEHLIVMLRQVREIDSIINDSDCRTDKS